MSVEVPLHGGRITSGVVCVDDEVRRPQRRNADFAHAVLRSLERRHFAGAPRFLGVDERGRERLSYLPGWVAPDRDHGAWSDEQLLAASRLIRGFHDTLAASPLADGEETVCHNDLGPCNTVHRDGVPYAFIDWDTAAPGPRVLDVAHAVWRWAITSDTDELALDEQARRVRLMSEAYGGYEPTALLDAVLANQDRVIAAAITRQDRPSADWHRGERDWFVTERAAFERALR